MTFEPITPENLPELGECVVLKFADEVCLGSREWSDDADGWLWCVEAGCPTWSGKMWKSECPMEQDLEPTHFARLPHWEATQ